MVGLEGRDGGFVVLDGSRDGLLVVQAKTLRALVGSLKSGSGGGDLSSMLRNSGVSLCQSGGKRRPVLLLRLQQLRLPLRPDLLKHKDVLIATLSQRSLKPFRLGSLLLSETRKSGGVIRPEPLDEDRRLRLLGRKSSSVLVLDGCEVRGVSRGLL